MILKKQLWLYTLSPKGLTDIGLGFFKDSLLNTRRNMMVNLPRSQISLGQNRNLHQIATSRCCRAVLLETVPFSQHSSSGEDEDKEAPQKKQRTIVDS